MAIQFGGCTDAEAYELMRDRFCTHLGTGIELWDTADVPHDLVVDHHPEQPGYAAVFKNPWLAIPGVLILVFGMYAWAIEPGTAEDHA